MVAVKPSVVRHYSWQRHWSIVVLVMAAPGPWGWLRWLVKVLTHVLLLVCLGGGSCRSCGCVVVVVVVHTVANLLLLLLVVVGCKSTSVI